jgi:flavin-dependent dehydrogenase
MNNLAFLSVPAKKNITNQTGGPKLKDGSPVAVIGGGPAGSLFAYYLLDLAERIDLKVNVDIYEPRDFSLSGPLGCNMCAGIISESLIQVLALDGINLPATVVQRGMDSYVLHNDAGKVYLNTPNFENRIGTVFRGAGPKNIKDNEWTSFDGFLLKQATNKGANLIRKRVEGVNRVGDGLQVRTDSALVQKYDFLAVATGVNTNAFRLFEPLESGYKPPQMVKTYVREYFLGKDTVQKTFGQTIHFFLLPLPGLDYAAVVPKGSYVTICMLGKDLSQDLFDTFLNTSQLRECMPPEWQASQYVCHCSPRINLSGAVHPYADRIVFLGDCGVSRLYKDGIGAAYRAAKAAASAAIFSGIGEEDLEQYYGKSSQLMENDNRFGKLIFSVVDLIKPWNFTARALVRMVESEKASQAAQRRMSNIMWDVFTGSAPYQDIFFRTLHPAFWSRFLFYLGTSLIFRR